MPRTPATCCSLLLLALVTAGLSPCQAPSATAAQKAAMARLQAQSATDRADMMRQLGIGTMRSGAEGNNPASPHAAIYDESRVAPYTLPDPLVAANGQPISTALQWWTQRRPEVADLLEREMYGRIPENTPAVTWSVVSTQNTHDGGVAAITQTLRGHVDNSIDPALTVDMEAELTLPAHLTGAVPVIIAFDQPPSFWAAFARRAGHPLPAQPGPTPRQQALALGWGYALLVPTSIQADNGAGLTSGIIGLCNHGRRRTPEQWGALRAWGWGASRLFDYFQTRTEIDPHRIGISGHSRYGKAALVTMAFDPRFAIGYISSSGEGGAKLSRRTWGELVENLTADEYYWMAGNFLRYGGPLTRDDLPVDAHDLFALCAPRAVFVGAGTQAAGDGWADARGSFLALVAASPVYRLLGVQGLGTAVQPPVLTEAGGGPLAFRQHGQGHTPGPNWPAFFRFAQRELTGKDFELNLLAQSR